MIGVSVFLPLTRSRLRRAALLACALGVFGGLAVDSVGIAPAHAQPSQQTPGNLGFGLDNLKKPEGNGQMLLESDQLVYDYDKDTVAAVGKVKIYYNGYTLEGDRVTYDRKNGKMKADGSVRIVDSSGSVVTAQSIDVTENFGDGFVKALRIDTSTNIHFAANEAYREQGRTTTFYRGVYTACEPCRERPEKPPLWQVKAARIVFDHVEHMVHFRDAQLEFLGVPVAWLPVFSAPDPTVKRKSGFLTPSAGYTKNLGAYVKVPYFWALAPNYDLTLAPAAYTNQGFLADVEWRHRLETGQYTLRMAGINQFDPNAFEGGVNSRDSGVTDFRGGARTTGEFYLNSRWTFGWDATFLSDRTFSRDYEVLTTATDFAVSNVHLTGQSERNYFDARGYYFQVLTNDIAPRYDQDRQALVHPVIDHNYIFGDPVADGQLSITSNVTSLSRNETDFIGPGTSPAAGDVILGFAGQFNRASTQVTWERSTVGPLGMVFKPFAYLRGDGFYVDPDQVIAPLTENDSIFRGMAAAGLEWRWPIMAAVLSSTHVFEPIAQIIVRPDEEYAGQLPNEDAQSLVFDDSTLFDWDKFSGYDRVEGGTRLNIGMRYLSTFGSAATIQGVIGQSYQLAGLNSFDVISPTGTGLESGLETDVSDVVAGVTLDTGYGYFLNARGRFDQENFDVNRAEVTATGLFGPVTASASYLFLRNTASVAADPNNLDGRTDTMNGRASWKFHENWRLFGSLGYDLERNQVASTGAGLAYDDECVSFSVAYSETLKDYTDLETAKQVMVKLELRTLGATGFKTGLSN